MEYKTWNFITLALDRKLNMEKKDLQQNFLDRFRKHFNTTSNSKYAQAD